MTGRPWRTVAEDLPSEHVAQKNGRPWELPIIKPFFLVIGFCACGLNRLRGEWVVENWFCPEFFTWGLFGCHPHFQTSGF